MKSRKIARLVLLSLTLLWTPSQAKFIATFHRVGEGNCTTIAVPQQGNNPPHYMVVDCGSREHTTTFNTSPDLQLPVDKKNKEDVSGKNIPPSTKKEIPRTGKAAKGTFIKYRKERTIRSIREALGSIIDEEEETSTPISVKTVVISHPDEDHFKWIGEVVNPKKDTLQNIVLGGRPEKYLQNSDFKVWITEWLKKEELNRPKVFFLSDQRFASQDVTLNDLDRLAQGDYPLAPSLFSNPKIDHFNLTLTRVNNNFPLIQPNHSLGEAFNFGNSVYFQFLSVNPLHVASNIEENKYIRLAYSSQDSPDIQDPDNEDSLILKIINRSNSTSLVLTGDATALTLRKVSSNYFPEELRTNVLLASHHGSDTWGSNNAASFEAFKPNVVIFSNGQHKQYKHPRGTAYTHAKERASLIKTDKHEVTYYTKPDLLRDTLSPATFMTQRSIFSTFDSGSLQVTFEDVNNNNNNLNGAIVLKAFNCLTDKKEEKEKPYYLEWSNQIEEDVLQEIHEDDLNEEEDILWLPTPKHPKIDERFSNIYQNPYANTPYKAPPSLQIIDPEKGAKRTASKEFDDPSEDPRDLKKRNIDQNQKKDTY